MTERGSAQCATPSIPGRRCYARPGAVGQAGRYFNAFEQAIGSARSAGTTTSSGAASATILIALRLSSSLVIGCAPAATTSTLPAGLCATPGSADCPSHDVGCVLVFWRGALRDLSGVAIFASLGLFCFPGEGPGKCTTSTDCEHRMVCSEHRRV